MRAEHRDISRIRSRLEHTLIRITRSLARDITACEHELALAIAVTVRKL
jgi:hypothetical protein